MQLNETRPGFPILPTNPKHKTNVTRSIHSKDDSTNNISPVITKKHRYWFAVLLASHHADAQFILMTLKTGVQVFEEITLSAGEEYERNDKTMFHFKKILDAVKNESRETQLDYFTWLFKIKGLYCTFMHWSFV